MFPLPDGASASGFTMKIAGKVVKGEVLDKDKARSIYEGIVRRAKDPGLLEYVDRGLIRARVFPIPARGDVDVSIEYVQEIIPQAGLYLYRYPLGPGKHSMGPYKDVAFDIKIDSSRPLRSINCLSHKVGIHRTGELKARVGFEAASLAQEGDFLLMWNVGEDALAPLCLVSRGHEEKGYFNITLSPRVDAKKVATAKDVVFVIDTSGSMRGHKMEQAKKALVYCIEGLNDGDRFNVVDFSIEARRFSPGLVATEKDGRSRGLAYAKALEAGSGTNLEEAMRFALGDLKSPERLQMVVVLTDGMPTIGVTSPEEIMNSIKKANSHKRRMFVFGVGQNLNAKLLDRIAGETRGTTEYIRDRENIELRLSAFYDKIDSPVLTNLRIEFPDGGVSDVFPRDMPDLFHGVQLSLFGRYQPGQIAGGNKNRTVLLRGKYLGEERAFEYSFDFSGKKGPGADQLSRLWAARKIGYLLEQIRLNGGSGELKSEVVRLSKLHGIITPYTSYLIVEEGALVQGNRPPPPGSPRPLGGVVRDALDARSRQSGGSFKGKSQAEAKRAFDKDRGASAVESSREISRLKNSGLRRSLKEEDEDRSTGKPIISRVGSLTFYRQGEHWVDSRLTVK
ncbi:MAG: VWA domain-containing protein, partial [Planctomycetota bacterium]